jgi:hypothetical protein
MEDGMTVEDRVSSLIAKHAKLEIEIQEENQRPLPDAAHLSQLKREKLKIKDQIARIGG